MQFIIVGDIATKEFTREGVNEFVCSAADEIFQGWKWLLQLELEYPVEPMN